MSRTRASVVVLVAALVLGGISDLGASTSAMACCARTHGQCAGMKSADDCCTRMGHAAPIASAVLGAGPAVAPATMVAATPGLQDVARAIPVARVEFTRPHDPPHLHAFAVLI